MSSRIDVNTYDPQDDDKIFLDANIWLYLLCPIGNSRKSEVECYSRFFLKLLKSKCRLYTSSLVISEFFNTYCRLDFKIRRDQDKARYRDYKKDFRNTSEFNELAVDICNLIQHKIFKHAYRLEDNFSKIDMNNVLVADQNYDFNDKYFAQLCEENNIMILTNDKDFLGLSNHISIITR